MFRLKVGGLNAGHRDMMSGQAELLAHFEAANARPRHPSRNDIVSYYQDTH